MRVINFPPILTETGDPEAMFPRSHYTRAQAIAEAHQEWEHVFGDYRQRDLHAVASAVRLATLDDIECGMCDAEPERVGHYYLWCHPNEPDAISAWLVKPKPAPTHPEEPR